jgi:hypothetical protein
MRSVLSANQRAMVRVDTGIDLFIIDRVCDAFDCLERDNIEGYKAQMMNAMVQLGLPSPIPESEKPTAVDKMKTICIRAAADRRGWSFQRMATYFRRQLEGVT